MGFFEDIREGFVCCDDEERAAMDDEGLDPTCPEDRRLFRRLSMQVDKGNEEEQSE